MSDGFRLGMGGYHRVSTIVYSDQLRRSFLNSLRSGSYFVKVQIEERDPCIFVILFTIVGYLELVTSPMDL
jgi:hypothetical protein